MGEKGTRFLFLFVFFAFVVVLLMRIMAVLTLPGHFAFLSIIVAGCLSVWNVANGRRRRGLS